MHVIGDSARADHDVRMIDLGPQYARDDEFTARMRLHQSWYRAERLRVACGTGPLAQDTERYGNMLQREDGERGLNFLTPEIAALAVRRQQELPAFLERHRLLCNMLSSQPMCFNLFGPVALDAALAPRLMSALLDEKVSRVLRVVIEHAPEPPSRYLDDRTSFDAYVELERADGTRGFVGIETKLTEPFSAERYSLADRPAYAKWVGRADAPWLADRRNSLEDIGHNQLWRDHMLAFALATENAAEVGSGALVLVRHPDDRRCTASVTSYQRCLREGCSTLIDRPLDDVVRRWAPVIAGTPYEKWLAAFRERYVDLSGSSSAWKDLRRPRAGRPPAP